MDGSLEGLYGQRQLSPLGKILNRFDGLTKGVH